jgi:hypothetical protein
MCRVKRGEIAEGWGKRHSEELRGLYCSPDIIEMINDYDDAMGSPCSTRGREEICVRDPGEKARREVITSI